MKKYLIYLLMLVISAPAAMADTWTTVTERFVKEKKQYVMPKLSWYGKVGVGIGLGKYEKTNPFEWPGTPTVNGFANFDLAFGFQSHFRPSNPSKFYWGAELGLLISSAYVESAYFYSTSNYKLSDEWYGGSVSSFGGFVDLTIGYKSPISSSVILDIHAAPEFKIGTEPKTERCYESYSYTTWHSESVWKEYDCGFKIGAGVWIKRVNIDMSVVKYFREDTCFPGSLPPYLTFSFGYKF